MCDNQKRWAHWVKRNEEIEREIAEEEACEIFHDIPYEHTGSFFVPEILRLIDATDEEIDSILNPSSLEFNLTPQHNILEQTFKCTHPGCEHHVSHPCEGCGRQWGLHGEVPNINFAKALTNLIDCMEDAGGEVQAFIDKHFWELV